MAKLSNLFYDWPLVKPQDRVESGSELCTHLPLIGKDTVKFEPFYALPKLLKCPVIL